MSDIIEYKGYHTRPEFSAEDDLLTGEIMGINDLIVFAASSIKEFRKAFHQSVDGYLDMCKRQDKTPDKEYSGRFNFRLGPELHKHLNQVAAQKGISLNAVTVEACEYYLRHEVDSLPDGNIKLKRKVISSQKIESKELAAR